MLGYLLVWSLFSVCVLATSKDNERTMKEWAILVAGSNGFYNYRHQADVARAYHVLIDHGMPAERIITFSYDDIANNSQNPFRGKLFNDYSHKDYYAGLVIDYKGKDVTPRMFMRVLMGDATLKKQGLKVLESGPNDHVFIYFTDHGAPGFICFPDGELYADQLNQTITYLHQHHMFGKLVVYIEACESGSMFDHILSTKINVFATTATNPKQPSYAAFCDDNEIDACLADDYSYNWLVDSETHDLTKLTLQQQFKDVQKTTVKSHVKEYGDKNLGKLTVSQFQGDKKSAAWTGEQTASPANTDHIPSRHTHIHTMKRAIKRTKTLESRKLAEQRLMRAIKLGELAKETMNLVVNHVKLTSPERIVRIVSVEERLVCLRIAHDAFKERCFSIQRVPEVAEEVKKLDELCAIGVPSSDIVAAIENSCL